MIDIVFASNYAKFDEVKSCTRTYDMWIKLKYIYGGDDNIKRAKVETLRVQFDQMKMREDENIAKYVERIKASVSAIKASRGDIDGKIVVRKVLRTRLPIYAIRVSTIPEMRCDPNSNITLDALVGRLPVFELDAYDNYSLVLKVLSLYF